MKEKLEFIAVDLQNDFATKGGKWYVPRPAVDFLKQNIFPSFCANKIKVNEIISDYRQPRPGDRGDGCHPGTWGYASVVPDDLRKSLWVKCMNSPVWVRKNIGNPNATPGLPCPDPEGFKNWLEENVGQPEAVTPVLMGLTIDCCVLSTLQEINWRGYYPLVIREAVDHVSGKAEDRDRILESPISQRCKLMRTGLLSSTEGSDRLDEK